MKLNRICSETLNRIILVSLQILLKCDFLDGIEVHTSWMRRLHRTHYSTLLARRLLNIHALNSRRLFGHGTNNLNVTADTNQIETHLLKMTPQLSIRLQRVHHSEPRLNRTMP
jgi:hypothetical protein